MNESQTYQCPFSCEPKCQARASTSKTSYEYDKLLQTLLAYKVGDLASRQTLYIRLPDKPEAYAGSFRCRTRVMVSLENEWNRASGNEKVEVSRFGQPRLESDVALPGDDDGATAAGRRKRTTIAGRQAVDQSTGPLACVCRNHRPPP